MAETRDRDPSPVTPSGGLRKPPLRRPAHTLSLLLKREGALAQGAFCSRRNRLIWEAHIFNGLTIVGGVGPSARAQHLL